MAPFREVRSCLRCRREPCLLRGLPWRRVPASPGRKRPLPAEQSCEAFVAFLHSLGLQASTGFEAVSGAELAMPGPSISRPASATCPQAAVPLWVDLRQELALRFGWEPAQVRFSMMPGLLLGESAPARPAASPRRRNHPGTGIGSAFAVDGRVVPKAPASLPAERFGISLRKRNCRGFSLHPAIQADYQKRTGKLTDVAEIAASAANDPDAANDQRRLRSSRTSAAISAWRCA